VSHLQPIDLITYYSDIALFIYNKYLEMRNYWFWYCICGSTSRCI